MGNRQSPPSPNCDLISDRGEPITAIASLCARWLLPTGGENEGGRKTYSRGGRLDGKLKMQQNREGGTY